MYDFVAGTEKARWYARVGMKLVILLWRPAPLRKKKLALSLFIPAQSSVDIADFPDPAAPYNQQIG